jgi:cytidine diphosphoramidate kinase
MRNVINTNSRVVWITGLSGAGKSTLASSITSALRNEGKHVVMLDGDELREVLATAHDLPQNHSREGRLALAMQYSRLCQMLAKQGIIVVIATISMFKEIHEWNRINIPGYFEIYLKVPLEELQRRDPKQIYSRYEQGLLHNVAGLDLAIDEPLNADWISHFNSGSDMHELTDYVLKKVINNNKIF